MSVAAQEKPRAVLAELVYTVKTGEKPSTSATAHAELRSEQKGERRAYQVPIHDARALAGRLSIDREGFQLERHDTTVGNFLDEAEVRAVYYPETERLVKQVSGAARVLVFDHTLRSTDESVRNESHAREPVLAVHNDYTEWSGPQRVRDLLPAEAEELLRHRVAVIQTWRPIRRPAQAAPLAICDARSIAPQDLIPADRRYPDRVGEIYQVAFNPGHRWYYVPNMQRNEAFVLKCYDSAKDGRARFTAHTAFIDPTSPPDAPPRESIEMRTLAFFAD